MTNLTWCDFRGILRMEICSLNLKGLITAYNFAAPDYVDDDVKLFLEIYSKLTEKYCGDNMEQ